MGQPTEEQCVLCLDHIACHQDGCFFKAGVIAMHFGYGSGNDTDHLQALICDDCAYKLVQRSRGKWKASTKVGGLTHWGPNIVEESTR